ncbi:glutathione-disulfide reductase [Ponticaulis sp.]|uniref:glutathione-disulfide reductase n=1 Tax=Ponticaulis sp. TaxID=2020902 RepID=UPI000B72FEBC|nr:glutathione-disulfide reductase [Ponticaulis sp.]MAI92122.1 glutathione-disulfide reductase [Ponticaulis sp.]OUX96295.1 MAG: glutathione-disulfide reductase [Hyphomonadaceae bacterium TMED5]|tara:strand:+ start:92452 stop:93828 length:1377 start_codon:yes stop_codon:yes gene_type:complete
MSYDYDLFVIGAGSGGVRAARRSAMAGAKVAVAEEYRIGGTCVIRGCVPKKYMVYASEFGRMFEHAKGFGWTSEKPEFDFKGFMKTLHAEVDRLSGIYLRNLANTGVDVLEERAELVDDHTLRLTQSGKTVTAEKILIAVGGIPWKPSDVPGIEHTISSNEVFHLPDLPKRMVIAGGGFIAVEFAGVFAGLGVETTLVYRGDTVLNGFDWDIRTHVHEELKRKGVRVVTQAIFTELEKSESGEITVTLSNGEDIKADVVMMAVGREPATAGLGLENAGVAMDDKGAILVDEYSKTNVENIWAVGDVTNRMNLTPVAIREGQAFAETVFQDEPSFFEYDNVPTAVFSQPPVGTVGLSEEDARHQFGDVDVYKTKFRPMKDLLTGDEERVMMKLVVRGSDQVVVGCHIVGPDAPEIIQAVAIAVKMGATKQDFDRTCALHPSMAEELVTLREKYVPPELA